jgi:PAS domain S-box-containing protein
MNQTIVEPSPVDTTVHGVVALDGVVTDCNECFCRIIGCERAEVLGQSFLELSPEVQADGAFSRERWQRRYQAARAGLPQWFPWQFRNCDGRRVHALVYLQSRSVEGTGLLAHVHDLSNLRNAGWIKPDTQARLQRVLDHTKAIIFVKDRDGRYVFANRELERVVRMPAERIVGSTDQELWPAHVAAHFQANDAHVLEHRTAAEFEVTAEVGRQSKTFLSFKFPLFASDGEPYAVCGVATDITENRRTQDALTKAALAVSSAQGATVFQELVRYLATILEVDAALIAAPEDGTEPCQMRVHAFFMDGEIRENFIYPLAGTPCAEVLGQTFRMHPSDVCQQFPDDPDLKSYGIESYAGFPLHDGSGAPIGIIAVLSRAPMASGEFIESILKIFAVRAAAELERQRAEETLRRSEASYRAIFEASEDAVFIHDWHTGALVDVNVRACEMTGYSYDEMKRLTVGDLSSGEFPYTQEEAGKRIAEAKAGKPVRIEWRRRNKDGSLHWDEVVLRPAVIAGEQRVLAFTREITERKEAEQALRQAQKMEALGHLTGGIAHDFNNLLTSIMGYIVLAADQPGGAEASKRNKYLEQAQLSCARARDLIEQMLTFSRGQRGQPRPVALPPLIRQSLKLFGAALPAAVTIEVDVDREVPAVMLDPVHLDQILLNLCLNARDAIGGSGTIRVAVQRRTVAGTPCTACRQAACGEFVELTVEDHGSGIPADIVDRIFDPFFTTKDTGKGSGMGLASVHGLVHELGGHIVVDTAVGRGTRFRVLFPSLDSVGCDAASEACVRSPMCSLAGRVLVVDDEHAVGAFMRDLLESWGLAVEVAGTPAEALALVHGGTKLDLVITDQKMPGMTGIQLSRELHAKDPELPIILYTGFNEGLTRAEIDEANLRAMVKKPIDPHELFGILQAHLPARA